MEKMPADGAQEHRLARRWRLWRSRKIACPVPPAAPVFLESFASP